MTLANVPGIAVFPPAFRGVFPIMDYGWGEAGRPGAVCSDSGITLMSYEDSGMV
jgi:hypothetical protein